ncbi:amidase [Halomonas binhaiensis]|uniref:Amidase n=1 Tax=Halomonas binhaiensis TaxID=2562282 RepID=A0A5C1NLU8_9GAMM|nr:amidase [Halomonas binhaiensis]QEM83397.1 amidase [Halomonas binhaiensis]
MHEATDHQTTDHQTTDHQAADAQASQHEALSWTAAQLLDAYRSRQVSPSEYADLLIAHVERHEGRINALYDYDPERFLAAAKVSTQRWARQAPCGPLDGIPVTLKELIATRGTPVPHGTLAGDHPPADEDAPAAARLNEDGALLLAKTTCPDYGMLSSGRSSFHGLTRNPWNPDFNPGGSSSGAGAAAAAGFGILHLGTDIGGSIRLPAAWCGVVGFKPSLGRVPVDPYYVGRCAGPMTRSVADAALMMATVARTDRRDAMRLPPQQIDWSALDIDVRGMRIGVMMEAGCGLPVDEQVQRCVEDGVAHFRKAGAHIVPVGPVLSRDMLDGLNDFWRARQWSELLTLTEQQREQVLPEILAWADEGRGLDPVKVVRGFEQTLAMRRATEAAFDQLDAVISPVSPNVEFPAEWPSPSNDPSRPFEHIVFTVPWNMGEQPAIAIHAGFSHAGMPIGLQIITPKFEDMRALQLASAFEKWQGTLSNWPCQA